VSRPLAGPRRRRGAGPSGEWLVRATAQPPRGCVTLGGEIDLLVREEVRGALSDLRRAGCTLVDVDAAEVAYVDCGALGLLAAAQAELARTGGRLRVVRASGCFRRVSRAAGYHRLLGAPAARGG
jgi:anti-anti-sigma factor